METNPFATAKRQTKALKLAGHLHKHGITADEAKRITAGEWASLARSVGVAWDPRHTHEETVAFTIQMLAALAAEAA